MSNDHRRIEDVSETEDQAAREYEERMEDEYAKREGGAWVFVVQSACVWAIMARVAYANDECLLYRRIGLHNETNAHSVQDLWFTGHFGP